MSDDGAYGYMFIHAAYIDNDYYLVYAWDGGAPVDYCETPDGYPTRGLPD